MSEDRPADPVVQAEEYVLGCALFLQDGTSRARILHRGSKEECERAQALVPGVIVVPGEYITEARTFIWPASQWDAWERRVRDPAS
jgi:hypothetical protein